ncbi:hypothetical protein GJ496_003817 [Pomphorhynchus laevis]|nr:hypothetical protein GJ496_003817 [Pomphorhynchus laevis]
MRLVYNNGSQNVIHKVDDEICPGTSVQDELIRLHPESRGIEPSSVISQKVIFSITIARTVSMCTRVTRIPASQSYRNDDTEEKA